MMSTSALRPCLLVVSLIGLIGGGTCGFPRVKDTLEDACNDIRSLDSARTAATQMLAGPEDALPVLEIATERPLMKGGASNGNNHLMSEAMQTMDLSDARTKIKKHYQKRIQVKLSKIYRNVDHGLNKDAYEMFHMSMIEVWNSLAKLSLRPDAVADETSKEEQSEELDKIFSQFEAISNIIQTGHSMSSDLYYSKLYPVIFSLSDTLVAHLAFSARYKLINDDLLSQFLNNEDHWMITYHYFWGKFLKSDDLTSLNQGLALGLEGIPFTNDMQDYFKLLSPDTLMNLSRIDLAMRISRMGKYETDFNFNEVSSLAKEFVLITSPRTRALRFGIEINFSAFASKIANKLVELHENTGKIKLKTKIHNSKILIDTLNYLEKNMPIGSALELDHQPPSELQKIKRIIEAYEYFSGAMNSVYSKYVRIVQAEALKSFKKHGITDYNPNFSYLTQVDQQHVVKPSGNDHRDIGFSTIRRTKVILHELKQVKESDRRSLKQLQSDKKKVEEILGYAEWY
ncbi:hypothetical protein MJO29_016168 [Puccinia striiformis f. sp. tritici]|nr:hypothetical protein MJO29_016168 [Puccinia striiformis f. sp. tritici]